MSAHDSALRAAKAHRATALAAQAQSAQALERAQSMHAAAGSELEAAKAAEDRVTTAHAEKLATAVREGADKLSPALIVDTRARQSAEARVATTAKMLATLTEEHAQATAAAQAAIRAVEAAADVILADEAQALVAEVEQTHATLVKLGRRLRGFLPSGRVPIGYNAPPAIAHALSLIPKRDPMHTPLNEQHAEPADWDRYQQRRAALINGNDPAESDADAA
jgi:hypothetical protein